MGLPLIFLSKICISHTPVHSHIPFETGGSYPVQNLLARDKMMKRRRKPEHKLAFKSAAPKGLCG
jgi:hypothetical protein